MFSNFDEDLLAASEQSKASGSLTPILKKELWLKIQTRRLLEGKDELVLPPTPPVSYQITQAEKAKKARRREQNRRAAKRFRQNEKRRRQHLLTFIDDLESKNSQLGTELEHLKRKKKIMLSEIAQHGHHCSSCPTSSASCDVTLTPAAPESSAALVSVCTPGPCDVRGEKKEDVDVPCSSDASKSAKSRSEGSDDTLCGLDYDLIRSGRICLLLGQVPGADGQQTVILNIPGSVVTVHEHTTQTKEGFPSRQIPHGRVQGRIATAHVAFLQPEETAGKKCPTLEDSNADKTQDEPTENESLAKLSGQPACRHVAPKTAHDPQPRGFELGKVSCQIVGGKVRLSDAVALYHSPLPGFGECSSAETLSPSVEMSLPPAAEPCRQQHSPVTAASYDGQLHGSLNIARSRHLSLARNELNKECYFTTGPDTPNDHVTSLVETSSPSSNLIQQELARGKVEDYFSQNSSKPGFCKTDSAGKFKRHCMSHHFRFSNGAYAKTPASIGRSRCPAAGAATRGQRARAQSTLGRNQSHETPKMFPMHVPVDVQNRAEEVQPLEPKMRARVPMSRTSNILRSSATKGHETLETSREISGRLATAVELTEPSCRRADVEDPTPTNDAQIEKERQMQNIKHDKGFQQILGSIFKTFSSTGAALGSDMIPSVQARPEAGCLRSLEIHFGAPGDEGSQKGREEDDQGSAGGISGLEQRLESLLLLHALSDDVGPGDATPGLESLTPSRHPLVLFSGFKDLLLDSHDLFSLVTSGTDLTARSISDEMTLPRAEPRSSADQRDAASSSGSTSHLQQTPPCDVTQQTHTAPSSSHMGANSSDVMRDISNTLSNSDDLVNRLVQCLPSRELAAILS